MTDEVKRYGFRTYERADGGGRDGAMEEMHEGPFVRYSDCAKLAAEVESWKGTCQMHSDLLDECKAKRDALAERVEELESKTPTDRLTTFLEAPDDPSDCETMAAENDRLREALERIAGYPELATGALAGKFRDIAEKALKGEG